MIIAKKALKAVTIFLLTSIISLTNVLADISQKKMNFMICPQFKNQHHPIASRHRLYHIGKCLEERTTDPEEWLIDTSFMWFANDNMKSTTFWTPPDAGFPIVYNVGNFNMQFNTPSHFDINESCPSVFNHSDTRYYHCLPEFVNVSCKKYINNLYQHGYINKDDRDTFIDINAAPYYSYHGEFLGSDPCSVFDKKPSLQELWSGENEKEISLAIKDHEFEVRCLKSHPYDSERCATLLNQKSKYLKHLNTILVIVNNHILLN